MVSPSTVRAFWSKSARAKNGDPIAFWQLRQWQMRTLIGSPTALNRTAPHRHPPSLIMTSSPHPEERRLRRVSKDEYCIVASWFETAQQRLLTMRVSEMPLIHRAAPGNIEHRTGG